MTTQVTTRTWRKFPGRFVLPPVLAAIFILLTGLVDGNAGVAPGQWLERPMHLLANALPGLLFAFLLLALTRRALLSFGLAFLAQGILYAVNALKVKNLGTPLMPADFRMLGQLKGDGAQLLGSYLPQGPMPYLSLVAGVLIIAAFARYEPALFARRKTRGRRALATAALLALLGTLLVGLPVWSTVYDRDRLGMQPWSASSNASHNGMITTLMQFRLETAGNHPKPDPAAAMQFIAATDSQLRSRMQATTENNGQRPDIVVVQSESFFDPSLLNGYEHEDFIPNLHRLAQGGSTGRLHVPTFGGGTIRTEFEVLTGLSLRYFDTMQFPYLQMTAKVVPGMVRTLRAHGYETIAVHGNDGGFWNRATAFKAIGFDRFIDKAQFPANAKVDGAYMADSAMTEQIMAQLKDAGPPQLVFAISMEAHGPYNANPGVDTRVRDAIPVPASIEGQARVELQNYIYHLRHADAELGRLADLVARRDRPTLILFYGDHLPALVDAYRAAGFRDGQSMLVQSVPWLLVDPQHAGKPEHEDLAAWMLPGKLLERAGVHDDAYFALTRILAPQLAALTHAPDAPLAEHSDAQKRVDASMGNLALLRMKGKLDRLLPVFGEVPADGDVLVRRIGSAEEAGAAGVRQ